VDAEAIWLVIGVVLVLTEIISLTLVLGMLGVGALVAAGLALAGLGLVAQLIGFAGASAAMLLLVRPPVKAALDKGGTTHRTDARMLQGSSAVVVQRVTDDSGQVRLNGELWRARPYAGTGPVDVGVPVSVAAVEGATLLIYSSDLSYDPT
jgi:membrane protein implicated in regulation of membrane protease activity